MEQRKRIRARVLFLMFSTLVLCFLIWSEKKLQNHVVGKMAEQEKEWQRVKQEGFPCIVVNEQGNIVGTRRGELLRRVILDYVAAKPPEDTLDYHNCQIQADAFSACTNLRTLILPHQTEYMYFIDYIDSDAFRGCPEDMVVYCDEGCYAWTRLQELGITVKEIPERDSDWELLGEDTDALKRIQQKKASAHNDSVLTDQERRQFYGEPFFMMTESGQLFYSICESLYWHVDYSEIYLPREADTLATTFPNYIMMDQPITIPKNIVEISDSTFFASSLCGITFEEGSKLREIGRLAFLGASFTEIPLPDGLQEIGERAFETCEDLKEITIPESVQTIGSRCFGMCTSLERAVILNPDIRFGENVFDDVMLNPELSDDEINMEDLDSNFIPNDRLTIVCHQGSNAEKYAKEHGLQVEYLK